MILTENQILDSLKGDTARIEMDKLFNSIEYNTLIRQISVNNAKFQELPDSLKLVSIYMNRKGLDLYLKDTWTLLFNRKPPTIEEYLDPKVSGPFVEKMYDGWKNVILRDFGNVFTRQTPLELVFSGSIGIGKTSIARWLLVWVLLRICLMKNPQAVLNVTQETLLCLALFTITLDKAALALIKPFIALLEQSPFFQVVDKQTEFRDFDISTGMIPYVVRQKYVEFPNNVIINLGSSVAHALSYSVFAGLLDEAEWGSNSPEDAFALYTNLRERIRSRFLGSNYTLMCLVSSARYSQGIIADYVNNTAADDPNTKIYSFAIWDIKHFNSYKDKGHFYVLVGNKTNPHRILDAEEQISYESNQFVIPARCQVIKVPEVYRKDFQSRIEEALNNLAGIAVTSDSSYIFTADPMECKELSGEISIESNLGDGVNLFDLIPDTIVETVLGNTRFKINSFAPRYAHLDLAETGKAGITVVHPELNSAGLTVYVVDLLIEIYTNTKIDITAVKQLISSISGICNLRKFTSDQYQSTQLRQQLEIEDSIEDVALLSVVKTIEPYETLATLIQGGRIYTGFCPKLKKQLRGIQITNDGKVKQATYVDGSHGDLADSTTGAIWNAVMDMSSDVDISTSLVSNWYNKPKSNIKEEILLLDNFNSL